MKEIGNILGWLGNAKELSILQDAEKHVQETCKTVICFSEAVKGFIDGDLRAKTTAIEKVKESERMADVLRLKMVDELSEGLLLPPDREDLVRFVRTLDKIADWTNGAARILGFIEHPLPQDVLEHISSATDLIVESIAKLRKAIKALTKNDLENTLRYCQEVDHLEQQADEHKKLLIESIIHAKLEPISLLLSYQLAEYMEGITDKMEDAASFMRLIAIRSK